ncbi:MAG: PrsW family intramembrane metalloprotease [Ardenticatenaceae bacterium]|nr:PrsW family intramembrane metalloprotease [Ardenticatenaceae bacterium]MCB9443031.1 PrsW family intramembrane metalloprotease [Ardenticatenaceae bacterium]
MSSSTVLILSIIAAAIPTVVYITLIYWVDRYEKEPIWLLTAAFLWGAIPSVVVAFIANSVLSVPFYLLAGQTAGDALAASLIAPPVEETIKGLAVLGIFLLWRHEIDSPLDGIIYGAMVGMGFAMVENIYYFVTIYGEGGAEAWGTNVFMRGVIFGLNHALFTSMTGLGIALARMTTNQALKFITPIAGWSMAMFLHFLHNAAVSTGSALCLLAFLSDWGGILLVLVIIIWTLTQERRWIKQYLVEEVANQTLTLSQYQTACSGRQRSKHHLDQLITYGPGAYRRSLRFFYKCSELAYKKHHFALFQDEKNAALIERVRGEIARLAQNP